MEGNKYKIVRSFTFDNIRDFITQNSYYVNYAKKDPSIVCISRISYNHVNVIPRLTYIFTLLHYIFFSLLLIFLIYKKNFLSRFKEISFVAIFCIFIILTLAGQIYTLYVTS